MKWLQEFKVFAVKGNVVDMAVGIVVGTAFGKIVSSFVGDVVMPPIGLLIGGIDFGGLVLTLKSAQPGGTPVTLNYGKFIQTTIDFIIIAFAIFVAVKAVNVLRRKEEAKPAEPAAPSKEVVVLTEIRDILRKAR